MGLFEGHIVSRRARRRGCSPHHVSARKRAIYIVSETNAARHCEYGLILSEYIPDIGVIRMPDDTWYCRCLRFGGRAGMQVIDSIKQSVFA
jgi:hypothetical protein